MKRISKAINNRSITISEKEISKLSVELINLKIPQKISQILNRIIHQDIFQTIKFFPSNFVDLLFLDPPYNLNKKFNSNKFSKRSIDEYSEWLDRLFNEIAKTLKPTASIYVCGDWLSSTSIHFTLDKYFKVRNRITWEREKGRDAKRNWKNSSEDVWFCTVSDDYYFNLDAVKLKRKVLAPYKENGKPKDWQQNSEGSYRLTHPSNIWNDITVPFWSMPENTEHPTQKPEKLLAKIILASSRVGDIIFDPFIGSGTSAVVSKKLERNFIGVEKDKKFASIALKRLARAKDDKNIQGFSDGIFWERNSLAQQSKHKN